MQKPHNHATVAVLSALSNADYLSVSEIQGEAGARRYTIEAIRQTVSRLRKLGLLRRINGAGPGRPGHYAITRKGTKYLSVNT